jgi:hypothetical protein
MKETTWARLRIWVSLVRERNKHEGKTHEEQHKVQKWARANRSLARRLPYHVPIHKRMIDKTLRNTDEL